MAYKKNPVWDMTPAQKDKYIKDMIDRWKRGDEKVPLPSDIEGTHLRVKKKEKKKKKRA